MNRRFAQILPALVLAMVIGTAGIAAAQEGKRPAQGPTPEQQAKIAQMYKDFRKNTQELRTKLYAKRLELSVLANNANADPKRIEVLSQEIAELTMQLSQKRMDMRETMQKQFGIPAYGPCRFFERGPVGPKGDMRGPRDDGRRGFAPHHRMHPWMSGWEYLDMAEDFSPIW